MGHDPFSGEHSAEQSTPQEFFDRINHVWRFTLDVCATQRNYKVGRYFCPPGRRCDLSLDRLGPTAVDGLIHDWSKEICWMNPPYSRGQVIKWVHKAIIEAQKGAVVVALLPASVDTIWYEMAEAHARIRPVRGRLTFGGADNGAKQPNILAEFLPPLYASARKEK
jgi:site-specific DNA-methyltransferase (adenine-specific)